MSTAQDLGRELLLRTADKEVIDRTSAWEAAEARWIFDPQVDGVVGLLAPGTANTALVVCYLRHEDFELSEQFFEIPRSLDNR